MRLRTSSLILKKYGVRFISIKITTDQNVTQNGRSKNRTSRKKILSEISEISEVSDFSTDHFECNFGRSKIILLFVFLGHEMARIGKKYIKTCRMFMFMKIWKNKICPRFPRFPRCPIFECNFGQSKNRTSRKARKSRTKFFFMK